MIVYYIIEIILFLFNFRIKIEFLIIFYFQNNNCKTYLWLSNYLITKCRLKTHSIRQVDQVALQLPIHIGLACIFDCPSHLGSKTWNSLLCDEIVLSVSFNHELYLSEQPSHRTNSSFVPVGRVRLFKTFSMQYLLFVIS